MAEELLGHTPQPEKRLSFSPDLSPTREVINGSDYWFYFSRKQTKLPLIGMQDTDTGFVLTSPLCYLNERPAAIKAWSGARHSRAPGYSWEIMHEIAEREVNADEKIEQTVRGFGHASVADMARLHVNVENVPMYLAMGLFNLSPIHNGQEKSTRYQKRFGKARLLPLENYLPEVFHGQESEQLVTKYEALGQYSLAAFEEMREITTRAYTSFYKPEDEDQIRSLGNRVLDTSRPFLLMGLLTGQVFETSAREWSRVIGDLKASPVPTIRNFAFQVERFLAPGFDIEGAMGFKAEAPSLIKYTEVNDITNDNVRTLKEFLEAREDFRGLPIATNLNATLVQESTGLLSRAYTEAERMVAQYALTVWPGLKLENLLNWASSISKEDKMIIGEIITHGHDHHKELPLMAATTSMTGVIKAMLGELRDFNRQRGMRRFLNLPIVHGASIDYQTVVQILSKGYGIPLYLSEVKEFSGERARYCKLAGGYYRRMFDLVESYKRIFGPDADYSFIFSVLPLMQNSELLMHGDPKQFFYVPHLRVRNGGGINYRVTAYTLADAVARRDPYLTSFKIADRPDPRSREQFFDRS